MKKMGVIILCIIIVVFIVVFVKKDNNKYPYIGKYQCPQNNTILILDKNNNYTIINNLYREAVYTKGKYSIENNNMKLMLKKGETVSYPKEYIEGKIKGDRIEFNKFYEKHVTFYLEK
ncbi:MULTISPECIES: hypothetical protein [Clostridium]|uniref:Lipoprotein n=2 Tax=Clostridium TaxID=1485 RepID=D8GUV0_CLOLD|nr:MULTISPECIES: hypothetical protein [Clostridium]ADK16977.1 hypothetical protein CLJU_c39530 [Clostridium ljungdahlii DSM 13528]AGY76017.1 hypothetical protein CAETHG_1798 [Clostridium autoethanogenum DSM 10061]ALU36180.1 Hypothetical protein CLAU_1751 [Clostridium autoethanogenum DSM 10061]OAA85354.1 hypothetical protein WX45_00590 [Clostridium ljungdahlii DSM 13528]OVY51762.1 hypothetical protein WX72_00636 [Clostridium autoethanogenum]